MLYPITDTTFFKVLFGIPVYRQQHLTTGLTFGTWMACRPVRSTLGRHRCLNHSQRSVLSFLHVYIQPARWLSGAAAHR